jgi:hypothetical protein
VKGRISVPRYVMLYGRLCTNLGTGQDMSKLMFLMWFSDFKVATSFAANCEANIKSTVLGILHDLSMKSPVPLQV